MAIPVLTFPKSMANIRPNFKFIFQQI